MLLPTGNPIKGHDEILSLQPMMGCSEGLDAFRFSLKQVCPDSVLRDDAFRFFFRHQAACLKKNQNAPRPSEYPQVRGENVKTFIRWDHRLRIKNLFMTVKRVPDGSNIGSTVICRGQTHRYTVHLH